MRERPLACVPLPVMLLAALGLVLQLSWHAAQPRVQATAEALPTAVDNAMFWRVASLGDSVFLSRAVMLWLQGFDNQPGISVPFRNLDYSSVVSWLQTALQLDPRSQYPLLAASRLYAEVPDEKRQRLMLDFVHEKFLENPHHRWPWLAHAVVIAKHRLHDLPMALKFAQSIADNTNNNAVPSWARQMQIFLHEDLGEAESARILLGGLLESGAVTDPNELNFLNDRLQTLQHSEPR